MSRSKGSAAESKNWVVMADHARVRLRRIYAPMLDDGIRGLVDRLWPRGVSRPRAQLDEWCKDVAPSPELRGWHWWRETPV